MKLSIIIPVYNEAATVSQLLDRVLAVQLPNIQKEIIIIESNSTDGTREIVKTYEKKKGIKVANAPGFSKQAVAEMVIGLMFAVNRKIPLMDRDMRKNPFESDPGNVDQQNKYWGFDIKGKTMGILGLGRIGSTVATLALGLGMKVIAHNRSPKSMEGVEMVSKEELLKRADVVSLNITSSNDSKNFISE